MIKPDALARGLKDQILGRIKEDGFNIIKEKELKMGRTDAQKLYAVHQGKSFYAGLVNFITSGPAYLMALEREDAVLELRKLMGATDPRQAAPGTLRSDFKEDNIFNSEGIMKNVIHGSDSVENAKYEISIFF
ncbi:nucleoside-diphosphate kinase [Candidatus Saganbacteria bacterium]|nr:nucleoside-diphosphate kinase [Candidatus Saganbacteria bacterium]